MAVKHDLLHLGRNIRLRGFEYSILSRIIGLKNYEYGECRRSRLIGLKNYEYGERRRSHKDEFHDLCGSLNMIKYD